MSKLISVFVVVLFFGCASPIAGMQATAPATQPTTRVAFSLTIKNLSESLDHVVLAGWGHEVAMRYPNAVVLFAHGGDTDGEWTVHPDKFNLSASVAAGRPVYDHLPHFPVKFLVEVTRERFPGRPIVLVMCNPGGYRLDIPGVHYAVTDVLQRTDRVAGRSGVARDLDDFEDPVDTSE